jgi:hypothetical protein
MLDSTGILCISASELAVVVELRVPGLSEPGTQDSAVDVENGGAASTDL